MKSKISKDKRGLLDIPLQTLVSVILGVLALTLAIIPLLNMLIPGDFNKEVAKEQAYTIKSFVDYYSGIGENSRVGKCINPLKLYYLSNQQVSNSQYGQYVIVMTHQKVGLIKFDDFLKLNTEQELSEGFDSFSNLKFEKSIELNSFDGLSGDVKGEDVLLVFFVPSIFMENSFGVAFSGDAKAGYYVFYKIEGKSGLSPTSSWTKWTDKDPTLGFGYFKNEGSKFGPISTGTDEAQTYFNSFAFGSCLNIPQESVIAGESSSDMSYSGVMCVATITNTDSTKVSYENTVHWSNQNGGGYRCGSDDLNFCDKFESDTSDNGIFQLNRESGNYKQIRSTLEEFTNTYYLRNRGEFFSGSVDVECSGPDDFNTFISTKSLLFSDYFEKVETEKVMNFLKQKEGEEVLGEHLFSKWSTSFLVEYSCDPNFDAETSYTIGDEEIWVAPLCGSIIYYQENQEDELKRLYFIDTYEESLKGFYYLKEDLDVIESNNYYKVSLAQIPLQSVGSTLSPVSCTSDCSAKDVLEIIIPGNFFTDIGVDEFKIYEDILDGSGVSDIFLKLEDILEEVSQNNKAGENNEKVEIGDKNFTLNTKNFNVNDWSFTKSSSFGGQELIYYFRTQIEEKSIAFELQQFSSKNPIDSADFDLSEVDTSIDSKVTISLEQFILSLYDSYDLILDENEEDIENKNFRISSIDSVKKYNYGDNSLRKKFYILTTKTHNKPVFIKTKFTKGNRNEYISPAIVAKIGVNDEFDEKNIKKDIFGDFVLPQKDENGNINFVTIGESDGGVAITKGDLRNIWINEDTQKADKVKTFKDSLSQDYTDEQIWDFVQFIEQEEYDNGFSSIDDLIEISEKENGVEFVKEIMRLYQKEYFTQDDLQKVYNANFNGISNLNNIIEKVENSITLNEQGDTFGFDINGKKTMFEILSIFLKDSPISEIIHLNSDTNCKVEQLLVLWIFNEKKYHRNRVSLRQIQGIKDDFSEQYNIYCSPKEGLIYFDISKLESD